MKKHDNENKQAENRKNGYNEKTVRSQLGDVTPQIPRDRDSEFESDSSQETLERRYRDWSPDFGVIC